MDRDDKEGIGLLYRDLSFPGISELLKRDDNSLQFDFQDLTGPQNGLKHILNAQHQFASLGAVG